MNRTDQTQALMNMQQQSTETAGWPLAAGEAQRLVIGPGPRWLKVQAGLVWVTLTAVDDAASEDLWLQAGQALVLPAGVELVLEGRGAARFELLVPPRACRGRTEAQHWPARLHALARRWRSAAELTRGPSAPGGLPA